MHYLLAPGAVRLTDVTFNSQLSDTFRGANTVFLELGLRTVSCLWIKLRRKPRPDQRERELWQPRFKEERDCSSKCVRLLGDVINRANQIVCL